MSGQSFILLAVGFFSALVVTVAGVNHYLLQEYPPSEAAGLLWRVENAVSSVQDLRIDLSSTEYGTAPATVRMTVRVLVSPVPALSVQYTEPESLAGQVVTVQNDLLSHYLPQEDLVVVKRWSGVPLAAVGLAGLDVSRLRAEVQQGTVTARVVDDIVMLSSESLQANFVLTENLVGPSLSDGNPPDATEATASASFSPSFSGFASSTSPGTATPTHSSYIVEVRDAKSGDLTQALWIDRGTYFIQKVVYYQNGQRVRTIEVERLLMNQGLTINDVMILPRASATVRG
jgi:hypothetical protein